MSYRDNVPALHVIDFLRKQLGKLYVFAGVGPDGFDCSGLTMMAWKAAGVTLPHNSDAQFDACHNISGNHLTLEPGDLVFYHGQDSPTPLGHVGVFIGYRFRDGAKRCIQATNEERGIEAITMNDYEPALAFGRPDYPGWNH